MDKLQKEYNEWLAANLPLQVMNDKGICKSADSLMSMIGYEDEEWSPNEKQYAWLADFCKRWDKVENS